MSWSDTVFPTHAHARNAGSVVQVVNTQTGAVATGATTFPTDDSVPQNTEGNQYMTLAITPTNTNNKLLISVVVMGGHSANERIQIALFQDSTANALAAIASAPNTVSQPEAIALNHYVTAGTTSSTTFKVRAGASSAGTTTINGSAGSRYYGGVAASSITIWEIQV